MNIILAGLITSVVLTIIVWAISRYIQHARRVQAEINEQKAELIAMIDEAVDETPKIKRTAHRPRPISSYQGLSAWSKWGMGLAWLPFFVALVFVGAQSLSTSSPPIPAPSTVSVPSPATPAPTPALTRVLAHVGEIYTVTTGAETVSTGLSSQRKLATASDGSLHVAYTRKDHNGISQIYYAESNNGGETWTEEQITNAPRRHGFPSIAIDSKDNIHVAWEYREGSPGGSSETCAIQYRVKTTTWQPIEDVIRNQSYPSIAIDSEDNVHLVVGGYWGGAYNAHYVKYVKRGPSGWGSPETVSSNGWANAPAIAIDQNNNVHVVYTHSPKYGSYSGLRYRERIPSGWQSEEIIQEDDQGRGLSSMALDSSSNVYVVWDNADAGGIKIRKRTSSGWQATGDVYTESGYSQKNPVISIDGNDYLHVVWQGKYSESPDYYQIRHRRYTTSWQPPENLTSSITDNQSNPSLMWAPYPAVSGVKTNRPWDGYYCMWVDGATVKYLFMSFVSTTTPPAPTLTLTPAPTPIATPTCKIAFVSQDEGGNFEIYLMNTDGSNQTLLTKGLYPTWSPDGSHIAFRSGTGRSGEIYVIDADGSNMRRLTYNDTQEEDLAWSPDGSRIAFVSVQDLSWGLCVIDIDGSNQTYITTRFTHNPTWSPNGSRIAFASNQDGNWEIYVMDADGSNQINLTNNPAPDYHPAWSPDGSRIVFVSGKDGNREVYAMDVDGSSMTRLTHNSAADWYPAWSPNGRYIVFSSHRDGNPEIYVMDADGSNQTRLTYNYSQGTLWPVWGCIR